MGQGQQLRSVGIGQGSCPAGEVLEGVAVFIQAPAFEFVYGHGIVLLFRVEASYISA